MENQNPDTGIGGVQLENLPGTYIIRAGNTSPITKTIPIVQGKHCTHYRQPIHIGKYNFLVTSYRDFMARNGWGDEVQKPDYGLYFAHEWIDLLGDVWSNRKEISFQGQKCLYPATVVNWPDFGVIKPVLIDKLIKVICTRAGMGQWVDIGCYGSHGRTGTFLACLLGRLEHMNGTNAIMEIRSRYCKWAVESKSQVDFVVDYLRKAKKEVPIDSKIVDIMRKPV